eukprot:TRINITY_DN52405_c0_g1_i1.p1 TRINITY_DN52405_c0_g1~~TRINITY_DN52405_c0_g1_i1.p1  ORF type:complete len:129 (+),score=27.41 TRINITY_DN52405_c0_g1_i1:89-475(+)
MDALRTANLRAFVVTSEKTGTMTPGEAQRRSMSASRCTYERQQLAEARRTRGRMVFMDRMEADKNVRQAYGEIVGLRGDPGAASRLDKMVERMRPAPEKKGPTIVKHSSKSLFEGHDRKAQWAPLECY